MFKFISFQFCEQPEQTQRKLSVFNIHKMIVHADQETITQTSIVFSIEDSFGFNPRISSGCFSLLNNYLIFWGGINDSQGKMVDTRNNAVIAYSTHNNEAKFISIPNHLKSKLIVFGGTAINFHSHTLIFMGGSMPLPAMSAGRVITMYTKLAMVPSKCDLGDNCIFDPTFHGNPLQMECVSCKKLIHITLCDKILSKRAKNLKLPKKYICFICVEKDSRKRKRK